ncbi:hypothetical protein BC940DRAFT_323407 [Gongronella butleri]|nr:hypothetical protein BC940DRAFT_323407 [Gongronella butleri]
MAPMGTPVLPDPKQNVLKHAVEAPLERPPLLPVSDQHSSPSTPLPAPATAPYATHTLHFPPAQAPPSLDTTPTILPPPPALPPAAASPLKKRKAKEITGEKPKRGRPPLATSVSKASSPAPSSGSSPTSASTPPSTSIGKTKTKEKKVNGSKKASVAATTAPAPAKPKLYCVCQKPYDAKRTMIACDHCDQWFHCQCLQLDEKQVNFIDMYFCEKCSEETGRKTSWKEQCHNPLCSKAARHGKLKSAHMSKYCSDACGMQVAQQTLALANQKRLAQQQQQQQQQQEQGDDKKVEKDDKDDKDGFKQSLKHLSKTRLSQYADMEDRHRLMRIRQERARAIATVNMVDMKRQFLQALVASMDKENRGAEHCGFDSRLQWDDDVWCRVQKIDTNDLSLVFDDNASKKDDNGIKQEEKGTDAPVNAQNSSIPPPWTLCQRPKRCQRHHDWIKLKTNEIDQEREEQLQILSVLTREREVIRMRMKRRSSEFSIVHSLMNGTLVHQ